MSKKQKFYSILQDLFVGVKLEGNSGFVNLMNIKTAYFEKIRENISKEIEQKFPDEIPEDLYDKLYTFFDSYFSDGGSIFFSSTPVYKNIYAQVYSDREDVSLFWKTAKLYYVKSEANYQTIKNLKVTSDEKVAFDFDFDASLLKHKQANEKKELEFYFLGINKRKSKDVLQFRVIYKNDNKYKRLEEILNIKSKPKVVKYLFENLYQKLSDKIELIKNDLDFQIISDKSNKDTAKSEFIVTEKEDLQDGVSVEPAIVDIKEIEKYLKLKGIHQNQESIEKAFRLYKKQTEIDYFIHKDARSFLREQFDLYMYQRLANDLDTIFVQEDLNREKKLKEIAYLTIDYIANFEDELKAMWLKPKFARNSNYVLTLNKIAEKEKGNEMIQKIIKDKGISKQLEEWKELGMIKDDFNKKDILKEDKLNKDWQYLPVDTKHFKDLEAKILELFEELDEELDGRLIKSENFQALNTILTKYKDQVQCIYIDPPFNTGSDFAYVDNFQDSTWLSLMNDRIKLARKFLKDDGSFYLHLDHNASHVGKSLMNDIFGKDNYVNEVIWCYKSGSYPDNKFARKHDNIFFFSKNNRWLFNLVDGIKKVLDQNSVSRYNKTSIDGRKYAEVFSGGKWRKYYLDEVSQPIEDFWVDIPMLKSNYLEVLDFQTQKPEKLLERILIASSNNNSLILDFFTGSATTSATAHKLGRKWLGVEMGDHFEIKVLPRMKTVLFGRVSGISESLEKKNKLKKGGFFKYYSLEQYEEVLKRSDYNPSKKELHNINFSVLGLTQEERKEKKKEVDELFVLSEKQAKEGLEIDMKKEKAKFVFEKLYPDVDMAETISNLFGKKIKQIKQNKVTFEDEIEIDLDDLDFEKYPELKQLIYW